LLFYRSSDVHRVIGALFGVVTVGAVVTVSVLGKWTSLDAKAAIAVGIWGLLGLISLVASVVTIARGRWEATFYEAGAVRVRRGRVQSIAYRDADVTYSIGRGLDRLLSVYPPGKGRPIMAVPRREKGPGDDPTKPTPEQVEALRDRVVEAIAGRLLEELAAGRSVVWCGKATLTPTGVQVGSTPVSWSEAGEKADQSTGKYALLAADGRTLTRMLMIDRNFLPGWRVFRHIRTGRPAGG
jgi:hypothetical protein